MNVLKCRRRRLVLTGLSIVASFWVLVSATEAYAFSIYLTRSAFSTVYPDSQSEVNAGCKLCHAAVNTQLNPYGKAICDTSAPTLAERITSVAVENADSDGNGDTNIYEINTSAQPGWTVVAVPIYNAADCSATGLTEVAPAEVSGDLDPSPEICDNDVDDNANGLVDCGDSQCDGFVGAVTSCGTGACAATGNLICQNLVQMDTCTPGAPSSEGPFGDPTCSDGIDNDCDGLTDAVDPDCAAPPEICDDGIDNNGNGLVDCGDPQCDLFVYGTTSCGVGACAATGQSVCQTPDTVDTCQAGTPSDEGPLGDLTCTDSIDNDCDGLTDASDPDCAAPPEICDDGFDNNGNELVDCEDPQCEGFVDGACSTALPGICAAGTFICQNGGQACIQNLPAGTEGPFDSPTCYDDLDNDCDALTDTADPDCDPVPEICDDGVDNNSNGLVDCADPECDGFVGGACDTGIPGICAIGTTACRDLQQFCDQDQQAGTEGPFDNPTCNDGMDNDCDGLTDAADPDCTAPVADVFLSRLKVPGTINAKAGQVVKRKATARGDGTLLTQDATVVLTGTGSPNLSVVVTPLPTVGVTASVVPGPPETEFEFTVSLSCIAAGSGTVDWTATISASSNDDPSNDIVSGSTAVTCRSNERFQR